MSLEVPRQRARPDVPEHDGHACATPWKKIARLTRKISSLSLRGRAGDGDAQPVPVLGTTSPAPPCPPVRTSSKNTVRSVASAHFRAVSEERERPSSDSSKGSGPSRPSRLRRITSSIGSAARSRPLPAPTPRPSLDAPPRIPERRRSGVAQPPWERSVDVLWEREPGVAWSDARQIDAFEHAVPKLLSRSSSKHTNNAANEPSPYFRLPDGIRFRICRHLIGDVSRAIRLNSEGFYRPVWPPAYFESLASALQSLEPYTSTCARLHADVLATLLVTRHFHVVWSPYVRPRTSPAAVHYVRAYAALMQHVTVELDLTKLGFAAETEVSRLGPGTHNLQPLVEGFVAAQKDRAAGDRLFNLRILVRRYHGFRRVQGDGEGSVLVPICDDQHLAILDPLGSLRGAVERVRIVGCSEERTSELIRSLWADVPQDEAQRSKHCRRVAPSTLYPLLPGQKSRLDLGPGRGRRVIEHPETSAEACVKEGS
ncbi:hypothetical protein VTK73DRAFT_10382 [Phialemonium thermophilum]|uniref:Uncharacterized protein n=1 Tax=Phialemonium thermophilum TaxID=223376 RepID=A0ABR3VWZ7_9PEZI